MHCSCIIRPGHHSLMQEVMDGFHSILEKVYPDDVASQAKVIEQLQQFRSMQGVFGRPVALHTRRTIGPHAWWKTYGACTPELQKMAIQVLSQVPAPCALLSGQFCLLNVDNPSLMVQPICRRHQHVHVRGAGQPTATSTTKRGTGWQHVEQRSLCSLSAICAS